jgi:hypothetical protein
MGAAINGRMGDGSAGGKFGVRITGQTHFVRQQVRLATVAARYSWNLGLARPKYLA